MIDGYLKQTMKCHRLKGSMAKSRNQIKSGGKARESGTLMDVPVICEGLLWEHGG